MKRQIVTFQKENIASLADMKEDIRQKMSDSEISYILSIESRFSNTGYNWNSTENKMTMTRMWEDIDYNSYTINFSDSRNKIKKKLESDDYTVTETIENI